MAQAAPAEIPVLAYLAIGLLSLLAWIVLRGLAAGYRHTFGWLLEQLAGILKFSVWVVHIDLGGPVRALDSALLYVLTQGAAKAEAGVGYFFHGAAVIQEWTLRELYHLGAEAFGWMRWMQHVHLPRWAKWIIASAFPPALIYRLVRAAVRTELPKVVRVTKQIVHNATVTVVRPVTIPYLGEWQWLHRHWKALTAAIATAGAGAIAGPFPWVHVFPRLRALEHRDIDVHKRLRRVEKLLAASGLAVAMANTLGLPNWRCLTRGNVGRLARFACGFPSWLTNLLVLGVVEGFVAGDLCAFTSLLTREAELIRPALLELVSVEDALVNCNGGEKNPDLTLEPLSLPPMYEPSAFAV